MTYLDIHIKKQFPNFSLNINVETDSRRLAFFGPSGAGKTTLLHCIAGLTRPDSGHIRKNQQEYYNSGQSISVPPEGRNIGYLMQEAPLFPHLNVLENITYSGETDVGEGKGTDILDMLEIESLLEQEIETLSGGEQRRVALARTLFSDPDLLLLDEPLVGLDDELRARILPYLRKVTEHLSLPLILVTHRPEEVLAICDTVVPIKQGTAKTPSSTTAFFQETHSRQESPFHIQNYMRGKLKHDSSSEGMLLFQTEAGMTFRVPDRKRISSVQKAVLEFDAGDPILGRNVTGKLSPRNRWEGIVKELRTSEEAYLVGLEVSDETIWVRVTEKTGENLNIQPGESLTVMLKVHAINVHPV